MLFNDHSPDSIIRYLNLNSDEALKTERSKYERGLSTHNKTFVLFHLILKEENKIIGWCGFHTWYLDHRRAEIGYVITESAYMNKGLMSEALTSVIHYGFNTMKLNRVEAFVSPDNLASLKLLKNFNFVKEGHLREHYSKDNTIEDSLLFSLLKSEYQL